VVVDDEDQAHGSVTKRSRKKGQVDLGHGLLDQAPAGLPTNAAADEPTIVRWVSRNIDNPKPDPRTCPDPFAWTLLRTCRADPAFVPFFVEKLWARLIPSRAQLESAGPKDFDGKVQLELIGRIEAMRDAAEGNSAPVASQKVKVDEVIVDVFKNYKPED